MWDNSVARKRRAGELNEFGEASGSSRSTFADLSSICSLPPLSDDEAVSDDELEAAATARLLQVSTSRLPSPSISPRDLEDNISILAESLDGRTDDFEEDADEDIPADAQPFSAALINDRSLTLLESAARLPLPSKYLLDDTDTESLEGYSTDEDSDETSEDDSSEATSENDELDFDPALQDDDEDGAPEAWTIPVFTAERDTADWMFDPGLFSSYNLMYGPFEVDACADDEGRNAQCKRFWSPSDSYNCHSWAG